MSAADVEREREKEGWAEKLFRLIPAFSLFFINIKVLFLCWASQLRDYACAWARQAKGTEKLLKEHQHIAPFFVFFCAELILKCSFLLTSFLSL